MWAVSIKYSLFLNNTVYSVVFLSICIKCRSDHGRSSIHKKIEKLSMKLLFFFLSSLFSANSDLFYPRFPLFPKNDIKATAPSTTNNMMEIKSFAGLRTRAQELISTLKQLENEPKAADTIKKLFSDENSVCLSSLEEAIEAIEEGTQLVEAAEGDLRALRSHVERLIGQTDEVAVMREVASILRALQPLLTKISPAHPANPTLCAASTDSSFDYLRRLALILHELSEDSEEHRAMLESSASTVSAVTVFLNQLRSELRQVQNLCHPDRQSSVSSIRALANIIANLADMTAVVGNHRTAEDIRKANLVTEKIMVS